jgi:hypothetical protein
MAINLPDVPLPDDLREICLNASERVKFSPEMVKKIFI